MSWIRKIKPLAVLLGCAVDFTVSLVLGLGFGIIYGILYAMNGGAMENLEQAVSEGLVVLVGGAVIGLLGTFLGGMSAAYLARQTPIFHGALVAVIWLLIGLFFVFAQPLWITAISYIVSIPLAMLGGWAGSLIFPDRQVEVEA